MYLDYQVITFCVLLPLVIWRYRAVSKLPPGPPARLLGNAHHIPRTEPWRAFKRFADQYGREQRQTFCLHWILKLQEIGPIITLWMFSSKTIVLNDYQTASDLLDQRSAIYSSRSGFWMSGYLAQRRDSVFVTKTTSPRFKIYRTLLHKTLNQRSIQAYKALQLAECQILLRGLLESPEKFIQHLRRLVLQIMGTGIDGPTYLSISYIHSNAVAIIMNVAYGYQVESEDDVFVTSLEKGFKLAGALNIPGKFWVEFFPLRKSSFFSIPPKIEAFHFPKYAMFLTGFLVPVSRGWRKPLVKS